MNTMDDLFPSGLTPTGFMREYERGKQIVDAGVRDYFILVDNAAFSSVREIGNTTLKDIQNVFGAGYISLFRFAGRFNCDKDLNCRENFQTMRIRPMNNTDKKKLRNSIRFFPPSCWICEWKDATGASLLLPFIQNDDGDYHFLYDEGPYRKAHVGEIGRPELYKKETAPGAFLKKIIENLPDYFYCNLARVRYKHTDILIPIPEGTAKATFRNREKDESGVKRRLVHEVREHDRKTLTKAPNVKAHLRGTSELTINGVDVELICSADLSDKYSPKIKVQKGGK